MKPWLAWISRGTRVVWVCGFFSLGGLPLCAQPTADPGRALALRTKGESELAAGHYAEAADHGAECAKQYQALLNAEGEAACWGIAGRAEAVRSRYPEAIAAFEKSVAVARANKMAFGEAATLNDLGNTRYFTGSYAEAHALYEEASRIVEAHKSEDWAPRLRQLTQANLAMLYQRLGQYERALGIYRRMEQAATLPPAQHAQMLSNIGVLYRRLGDPYKAMGQYATAAALLESNRDRDSEIGIVKNTGIALAMDLEDYPKAVASFENALRLAESTGNRREEAQAHLYLAETLRRMRQFDRAVPHAERALGIATETKSAEDHWKAIYTLGRIAEDRGDRTLALRHYTDAIARVESLRTGLGAASLRASFLGDKRNVYDGAIRVRLRDAEPDAAGIFREMEGSRARSLQDKKGQDKTGQDKTGGARAEQLSAVAARLPAGAALLEYWVSGRDGGVVWIAGGRSGTRRFDAPKQSDIAILVSALRDGSPRWKEAARTIGDAVLGVLSDLPDSTKQLVIVPDGGLASIPFEVLSANDALPESRSRGGARLLVERYAIGYMPSASLESPKSGDAGWRWPWRHVLAAFADPVLGPAPGDSLYAADLAPLPGARQEARDIAAIVGGARDVHLGAENRKSFLAATKQNALSVLHFATHGIADVEDPDRSRLVFSSPIAGGPADFLFAREIAALDLRGISLVTLAACDTETGQSIAGEGVLALSRAFLAAGAGATISTLWRVGDQSSAELMRRFYRRLAYGETAVDALRGAKIDFIHAGGGAAHPRYWAAFVLNGDAAVKLPKKMPMATAGAMAIVLACMVWIWRIRAKTRHRVWDLGARTEPA